MPDRSRLLWHHQARTNGEPDQPGEIVDTEPLHDLSPVRFNRFDAQIRGKLHVSSTGENSS
jgi:hypothetical protein